MKSLAIFIAGFFALYQTNIMKKLLLTTSLLVGFITFGQVNNAGIGNDKEGDPLVTDTTYIPEDTDEPFNFAALPVKPEFPGGYRLLSQQVNDSILTSNLTNITKGQQLKATLSFIVERDGSITDIKIVKDETFGYGKEVVRVLLELKTKWKPGQTTGEKVVRTYYIFPFAYRVPE